MKKPRRTPAGEMLLASELGREGRIFEEREVIRLLKSAIEREGDQTSFARRHFEDEPGRRSAAKLVVVPNHVPPPNDCDGANGNQGGDVIQ